MCVIAITGGRGPAGHNYQPSKQAMVEFWQVWDEFGGTRLVHGDARGCDRTVAGWVRLRGVDVVPYGVNERVDGPWPAAGHRRNRRMLEQAKPELLVAFVGGRGTAGCVEVARAMKIPVYLIGCT